ncbi:MAG: hypothetical protein ACRDD1_09645, partial [Planctomycetia bacterium]
ALKLAVAPETWVGSSDVKPLGKLLVIRNRKEVVEECVRFLEEIMRDHAKQEVLQTTPRF